jgi:hypothetical protein
MRMMDELRMTLSWMKWRHGQSIHHQPSLHTILILHAIWWWDFMLCVLFICRDHGEGMDACLRQHYQEQEQQQPRTGNGVGVGIPISGSGGGGGHHHWRGSSAPNATTTTHLSTTPSCEEGPVRTGWRSWWNARSVFIDVRLSLCIQFSHTVYII